MPTDWQVGVTERLEHGDLVALLFDMPPDHHVEQEGRHAQENDGTIRAVPSSEANSWERYQWES